MNPEEDGSEKEEPPVVFFAFQRKKRPTKKQIVALSSIMQKEASTPMIYFEKDKGIIMNLLESIEKLNKMLAHVQSRKLQYQKG